MKSRNETNWPPHERVSESTSPCASTILLGVLLLLLILPLGACASKDDVGGTGGTCTTADGNLRRQLAMQAVKYVPLFEGRLDRPAYHGTGFGDHDSAPDLRPSDEWWLREGDTLAITMSNLSFVYDNGNTANAVTCNWCGTGNGGPLGFGPSCIYAPTFTNNFAPIEVLEYPNFNTDLAPNRSLISGPALFKACEWFHPGPPLPEQRSSPAVITPTRDATFQVQVPSDAESPSRFSCAGFQEKPPIKVHVVKPGAMTAVPFPLERFPSIASGTSPDRRPFFSAATLGDPTKFRMNFSPDLKVESVTLVTGFFEGQNFVITGTVPFDSLILAHGCIASNGTSYDTSCLGQEDRCLTSPTDHSTVELSHCENQDPRIFQASPAYSLNNQMRPPNDPLFWVVEFEGTAPPSCFHECTLYFVFNLR